MLAKPYRLKNSEDFDRVKAKGKKISNPLVTLLYLKAKNERYPRFGMIVSTKISKHASARNRVERAISEGIRQNIYAVDKNYDCVVIARAESVNRLTNEIMHSVSNLIAKAGILKDSS
jgi:ribonuclease P protein component